MLLVCLLVVVCYGNAARLVGLLGKSGMASVSGYCKCLLIQLPLTENSSSGEADADACHAASAQFVLVQFLSVWGLGKTNRLRRSGYTFCIQGKMHTVKGAEHR